MVVDSGSLCRTKVFTFREVCGKNGRFRLILGCKLTKLLGFSCKRTSSAKLVTLPKIVASIDDLKARKRVKRINDEILPRITVQQSIIEACKLKNLLSGEAFASKIVTHKVYSKAKQWNTHSCCLVSDLD